jgi:hypothetical protein
MKQAADGLKKLLQTPQKIQQLWDIVSSVASPADTMISHDLDGITNAADQFIQMIANN